MSNIAFKSLRLIWSPPMVKFSRCYLSLQYLLICVLYHETKISSPVGKMFVKTQCRVWQSVLNSINSLVRVLFIQSKGRCRTRISQDICPMETSTQTTSIKSENIQADEITRWCWKFDESSQVSYTLRETYVRFLPPI